MGQKHFHWIAKIFAMHCAKLSMFSTKKKSQNSDYYLVYNNQLDGTYWTLSIKFEKNVKLSLGFFLQKKGI